VPAQISINMDSILPTVHIIHIHLKKGVNGKSQHCLLFSGPALAKRAELAFGHFRRRNCRTFVGASDDIARAHLDERTKSRAGRKPILIQVMPSSKLYQYQYSSSFHLSGWDLTPEHGALSHWLGHGSPWLENSKKLHMIINDHDGRNM
jgi:hypothetical protein